jgi:hypothetical protein
LPAQTPATLPATKQTATCFQFGTLINVLPHPLAPQPLGGMPSKPPLCRGERPSRAFPSSAIICRGAGSGYHWLRSRV